MGLYIGRQCIPGIAVTNDREKDELFKTQLSGAYEACEKKDAVMPDEKTMANLSATIDSIVTNELPKCVAVDGVKWDAEWEAKGQNGTIVDVVVGDDKCSELVVNVIVQNIGATAATRCSIDWGDGTVTLNASTNTTLASNPHVYQQPGHYVITVDNKATRVGFGQQTLPANTTLANAGFINNCNAVRRVRQFGSALTTLTQMFANCTYLNSEEGGYPGELPPIPPNVASLYYAFSFCLRYTGRLPYINHLTKCKGCAYAFYNMRQATGTAQILPPAALDAAYMYYQSHLDIPYDIFPDGLSATLTAANNMFNVYPDENGIYPQSRNYVFPKISHLVKCATMQGMFTSNNYFGGPLPELPKGNALTSTANMFEYCVGPNLSIPADYLEGCTNLKSIAQMFQYCLTLKGECPRIPSTFTGSMYQTFFECRELGGQFPTLPEGVTSMQNVFYNCRKITGSLPAIPSTVTDLRNTFFNCLGATGRFPSLNNVSKLTAGAYCTGTFTGCVNVTEPPLAFFDPAKIANQTSFSSMFSYCRNLKSFPFELSGYTGVTSCAEMLRSCMSIETGPKSLPPNVTTLSYMMYECNKMSDRILKFGHLAKLVNIQFMYGKCFNVKPLLAENGTYGKDWIYRSAIITYNNAFASCKADVCQQSYDACVANGAAGTKYGGQNIPAGVPLQEYSGGTWS